jgi:transketolase
VRTAFINALYDLAEANPRITLVVGDLGFGVVEKFAQRYPRQFVNAGVAEQNMTGIATGLALSGRIVFTYSIANFPTLRCLEQVRNDVCYHKADVKIVAVGAGFGYGSLGASHHATEDIAILRALPNMTVLAPADPYETEMAVRAAVETNGPVYIRIGRAGEPAVHEKRPKFTLGKAIRVREGKDIALIGTGGILFNTLQAAERLSSYSIEARVLSMHTLKPIDREAIIAASQETGAIFTVEEHSIVGGLGGAVAEVLAESGRAARFKRIGAGDYFADRVGSQEFMREYHGLTSNAIVDQVLATLGEGRPEVMHR